MSKNVFVIGDLVQDEIDGKDYPGGCGGNLAANLGGLGLKPTLYTATGEEFNQTYRPHLLQQGVNCDLIQVLEGSPMKRSILTSNGNGEYTARKVQPDFSGLALELPQIDMSTFDMVVISVTHQDRVQNLGSQLIRTNVPFYFDVSQTGTRLEPDVVMDLIKSSNGIFFNAREFQETQDHLGTTISEILDAMEQKGKKSTHKPFIISTNAAEGVTIYTEDYKNGQTIKSRDLTSKKLANGDALGCGDAFRAGFAFELLRGQTLPNCAIKGEKLAKQVRTFIGGQTHLKHQS